MLNVDSRGGVDDDGGGGGGGTNMLCFVQEYESNKSSSSTSSTSSKDNSESSTSFSPAGGDAGALTRAGLLRKTRSSGHIGCAGATAPNTVSNETSSATATTATVPADALSTLDRFQRSPSHTGFPKCDKSSLKHLSTSTPAMTAQAQLSTEPPSPVNKPPTKEPKGSSTLKGRQKKFNRHFPAVDDDEKLLNYYSCALIGDILLQGHLYITKNYFAFYSNVFGYVTKLLIPVLAVEKITKEKTARIIPNAVGITTGDDKHVFGSLMSRDSTYRYMIKVWEVAQSASLVVESAEIIVEPLVVMQTDSDTSREELIEVGEAEDSERDAEHTGKLCPALLAHTTIAAKHKKIRIRKFDAQVISPHFPECEDGEITAMLPPATGAFEKRAASITTTLRRTGALEAIDEHLSKHGVDQSEQMLPWNNQRLLLIISTGLLVMLLVSAAILLYRIGAIQEQYAAILRSGGIIDHHMGVALGAAESSPDDHRNEHNDFLRYLLHWQNQLHAKSAGAVHNFVDANLEQIAKIRKSLEALSALLVGPILPQSSASEHNNNDPS